MGFPKALLRWDEETYLDRQIRLFGAACAEVIVVLRPGAEADLAECSRLSEATVVYNPDADRGQLSSLQTGLAEISHNTVLFSPVDYAHVKESTIRLIAAGAPAPVLQPSYEGQHGHPVRITRPVIDALLAAPSHMAARDVVRQFDRNFLEIDDPGCVLDCDDPAAFTAIQDRLR